MIYTKLLDMPCSIDSFVHEDANGDYTICLNPKQSYEKLVKAYEHEIEHIKYDCGKILSVDECENKRHKEK